VVVACFLCVLDDYYDTEDPSVNLQDFIVNSMQVFVGYMVLIGILRFAGFFSNVLKK